MSRIESREGATLISMFVHSSDIESEEFLYLFGGLSRDLFSSLLIGKKDQMTCKKAKY